MYVKIHEYKNSKIVAICDEDIIGKKIVDKEKCLDISERYYKGKRKNELSVVKFMEEANNLNLVGKKTIAVALKHGIISKEGIIKIKNIPHAHMYRL